MNVFLCHAHEDKDLVEAVGSWLEKKRIHVWIDTWRLTPGDSLVEKIGKGIEESDRLVVFLSPTSVQSGWVRREVATGTVMELAMEKGLGEKFVVPVLLAPCKIPALLRDKVYANFSDKPFEAACEELHRGIIDEPKGPQSKHHENRVLRTWNTDPFGKGRYALTVEFGVRVSPTQGLHLAIDVGAKYTRVVGFVGPPNNPQLPKISAMTYSGRIVVGRRPPIWEEKFLSPSVSSSQSYYLYFEADEPFKVGKTQFLDFYDREP